MTVKATYNNKQNTSMTIQELETTCPSAFATAPHPRVSANYVFIPSTPIVHRLYDLGFQATSVRFKGGDRTTFGSHCIRFQQPNAEPLVGGVLPQLVLFNSHDRSKRFSLSAGLMRLVCSNGLTVPHWSGQATAIRTKHIGAIDITSRIESAVNMMPNITTTITQMMDRSLTSVEVSRLVLDGLAAREGSNIPLGTPFNAWNESRRSADDGNTLWLTLNRLQENLIHGVSRRSSGITDPVRVERINTTLWNTACSMLS